MINRENYLLLMAYLDCLQDASQLGPASVTRYQFLLRHLLLWADDVPISRAHEVRPAYLRIFGTFAPGGRTVPSLQRP